MESHIARSAILTLLSIILVGCATATVIPVGNARAPIDPSQVRIYVQPPPHFEVLGILSGDSGIEGVSQTGVSDTIKELKAQAAKLGANGVLLGKMGQKYSGSYGGSSYIGWGNFLGSSSATYSKTIEAQAIHVSSVSSSPDYVDQPSQGGAWPLPMPQFDVNAGCQSASGDVNACISAEHAARAWLAEHTTTVQIAGGCSSFAQQQQSYTMIKACVQQRERQH